MTTASDYKKLKIKTGCAKTIGGIITVVIITISLKQAEIRADKTNQNFTQAQRRAQNQNYQSHNIK